jgi:hypothetical protein
MASTVQVDILEGASYHHDLHGGLEITRVAIVTELTVAADHAALCTAAEAAVVAVVGARGSTWSSTSATVYLKRFSVKVLGATACQVDIIYQGYPVVVYEFDGGLNQVQSNLDVSGTVVTVQYEYPSGYDALHGTTGLDGTTETQPAIVSRTVPEPTFSVRMTLGAGTIGGVQKTASEMLSYYKYTYEGKVNSNSSYGVGYLVSGIRTWLVEKISGTTHNGGLTYEMIVVLHQRMQSWDELVIFTDPRTGKPPDGLVAGTGYKLVQVIPMASLPDWTGIGGVVLTN